MAIFNKYFDIIRGYTTYGTGSFWLDRSLAGQRGEELAHLRTGKAKVVSWPGLIGEGLPSGKLTLCAMTICDR